MDRQGGGGEGERGGMSGEYRDPEWWRGLRASGHFNEKLTDNHKQLQPRCIHVHRGELALHKQAGRGMVGESCWVRVGRK